jgi:hypothetical protein
MMSMMLKMMMDFLIFFSYLFKIIIIFGWKNERKMFFFHFIIIGVMHFPLLIDFLKYIKFLLLKNNKVHQREGFFFHPFSYLK